MMNDETTETSGAGQADRTVTIRVPAGVTVNVERVSAEAYAPRPARGGGEEPAFPSGIQVFFGHPSGSKVSKIPRPQLPHLPHPHADAAEFDLRADEGLEITFT